MESLFLNCGRFLILLIIKSTLVQALLLYDFEIAAKADDCFPPGIEGVQQYIVGFGSLMSTASKSQTYPNTSENIPVRVTGYQRVWNCKGVSSTFSTTYLGAMQVPNNGSFNGVIFSLDDGRQGLAAFDKREKLYCRKEVGPRAIEVLGNVTEKALAPGQYWIYIPQPKYSALPTNEFPIVQSYVDIFITGCLELEEKFNIPLFSDECINSTKSWTEGWINDRIYPRRPLVYQPKAGAIDTLLMRTMPKQFKQIKIE